MGSDLVLLFPAITAVVVAMLGLVGVRFIDWLPPYGEPASERACDVHLQPVTVPVAPCLNVERPECRLTLLRWVVVFLLGGMVVLACQKVAGAARRRRPDLPGGPRGAGAMKG